MKSNIKTLALAGLTAATLGIGGIALADRGNHDDDKDGCDTHSGMRGGGHHGDSLAAMGKDGRGMGKHHSRGEDRDSRKMMQFDDAQREGMEGVRESFEPQWQALRERMQANQQAMRELRGAETFDASQLAVIADERGTLVAEEIKLRAQMHQAMQALMTDEQREKMRQMKGRHG